MESAIPENPIIFLKPSTAIVQDGGTVMFPRLSHDLQHEVEMVLLIGRTARNVSEQSAPDHVAGYGIGLDMTLRDIQSEAKKRGLPWTVAKGFDTSAPVSSFVHASTVHDPQSLDIRLKVNGEIRQSSNTGRMIFGIGTIIAFISSIMTLQPGDLIFTGTPEGVSSVRPGDILEAELESVGSLRVTIGR
jgi:2-keto-4-pentenoate hydratase/2-oxohepta-3-ene-1,7-dioic acid hydratase in catechol pathway